MQEEIMNKNRCKSSVLDLVELSPGTCSRQPACCTDAQWWEDSHQPRAWGLVHGVSSEYATGKTRSKTFPSYNWSFYPSGISSINVFSHTCKISTNSIITSSISQEMASSSCLHPKGQAKCLELSRCFINIFKWKNTKISKDNTGIF